ncbi:MAG: manganese efflux pump MntP family protein [Butyricicoccaceae bacterium]
MGIWDIIGIGVGLSMDAVAVSLSNGMVYPNMKPGQKLSMPVFFGAFQALMPLIGYFAGGLFASLIERFAGIVIFIILGIIGGHMIWEGFHPDEDEQSHSRFMLGVLISQSIATSIDAFAVGVGFSAMRVEIFSAVSVIGITTFVLSGLAVLLGRVIGKVLENKAEIIGGVILVLIGIKSLIGL